MDNKKIICFGEVLWDMLPTGKLAGGAPMNVAYHLNALGVAATVISRVGNDDLGAELLDFLIKKEVPTDFIQTDKTHSTGLVNVELDEKGSPTYEIAMPVAWDFIENTEGGLSEVATADALVFGSLVCRHEVSRQTLFDLIHVAKTKVFDVNLREPFYDKDIIELLLTEANIVKMNEHELDIISSWYGRLPTFQEKAHAVQQHFDLDSLIISHGSIGAYCLEDGELYFQPSFKVTVQDTIGSGDAFLAGFLFEKMQGRHPQDCLITACRAGAYVATHSGATPLMNQDILRGI